MTVTTPKTVVIGVREDGVLAAERVEVTQGQTVRWDAPEGHVVSVWFPRSGVFETQTPDPSGAMVDPDAGPTDVDVEYCIYDHTDHAFVEGGSHPVMLIKEP